MSMSGFVFIAAAFLVLPLTPELAQAADRFDSPDRGTVLLAQNVTRGSRIGIGRREYGNRLRVGPSTFGGSRSYSRSKGSGAPFYRGGGSGHYGGHGYSYGGFRGGGYAVPYSNPYYGVVPAPQPRFFGHPQSFRGAGDYYQIGPQYRYRGYGVPYGYRR